MGGSNYLLGSNCPKDWNYLRFHKCGLQFHRRFHCRFHCFSRFYVFLVLSHFEFGCFGSNFGFGFEFDFVFDFDFDVGFDLNFGCGSDFVGLHLYDFH